MNRSTPRGPHLAARLLVAVLALLCVLPAAPVPAVGATAGGSVVSTAAFGVADLLDLSTYRIHTVRRTASSDVSKTVGAVIGLPALVNVDAAVLSAPDLAVEVLPLPPDRVSVLVKRLAGGTLPLSVELLFDLPGGTNGGAAFGYDALASSAPASFSTSVTFSSTPTTSDVRLDVDLGGPAGPVALIADLFTRGPQGTRVDPTAVRVALDPPPRQIGARVRTDVAANRALAELTATETTLVTTTVDETKVGRKRHVTAKVDRLPTSTVVDVLSDPDAGRDEIHYTASAPIASATVELTDTDGAAQSKVTATATNVPSAMNLVLNTAAGQPQRATWTSAGRLGHLSLTADGLTSGVLDRQARLEIDDLATALELVRDTQTSVRLAADSAIGVLEGGVSTGGPVQLLDEPAYLHAVTDGSTSSVAARIQGLSSFEAGLADPISVSASVAPGPFRALLVRPGRTVDAKVLDLPATAKVVLHAKDGVLEYQGSAVIGTIDAEITATPAEPIVERADHAHLVVTDLPTTLRLDFGPRAATSEDVSARSECVPDETLECPEPIPDPEPDPGEEPPVGEFPDLSEDVNVVIDANGAAVGSIDLLLNTAPFLPSKPLADDEDGLVLEDVDTRFVLAGRITGLEKAAARIKTEDRRNVDGFLITRASAEIHTTIPRGEEPRKARVELHALNGKGRGIGDMVATLSNIPPDVVVNVVSASLAKPPNPKVTRVTYDASGTTIGEATVHADLAAMPNPLTASITAVPGFFTLCHATDARCHDGDGAGDLRRDGGTFLFDATSAATLNAFLCLLPSGGDCDTMAEATSFVLLEKVSVQHLAFELNVGDRSPENPFQVVFDTDDTPVTGKVVLAKDELRATLSLPGDLSIPDTGPRLIGRFTGPLSAQDFVLTAFNPPGLVDVLEVHHGGRFGCTALEFLDLRVPPAVDRPLKGVLCPQSG